MKRLVLGILVTLAPGLWPAAAQEVPTVPPEIRQLMKRGGKLNLVWKDPHYDTGTGFTLGRISTQAEGLYANTIDYFPVPLARMTIPGSTNILNLTVTELSVRDGYTSGISTATMAAEGVIVDKDGKVVFAFATRDESDSRENLIMNCKAVMDRIAWNLAKDLGQPFQDAMAKRMAVAKTENPSGLPTLPAKPKDQQLSVGERLIQLDNIHRNGLITDEEYKQKREEILKGM